MNETQKQIQKEYIELRDSIIDGDDQSCYSDKALNEQQKTYLLNMLENKKNCEMKK